MRQQVYVHKFNESHKEHMNNEKRKDLRNRFGCEGGDTNKKRETYH